MVRWPAGQPGPPAMGCRPCGEEGALGPAVAVANCGTGGSWERPPDPMNRHALVQGPEVLADGVPEPPHPRDRSERPRNGVHKDRYDRLWRRQGRPKRISMGCTAPWSTSIRREIAGIDVAGRSRTAPALRLHRWHGDVGLTAERAVVAGAVGFGSRCRTAASGHRRTRCSGPGRSSRRAPDRSPRTNGPDLIEGGFVPPPRRRPAGSCVRATGCATYTEVPGAFFHSCCLLVCQRSWAETLCAAR